MIENQKQKNALIIAISGIVACLVGLGVVFLFTPKDNMNLRKNDTNSSSEKEVILGDTGSCGNGPAYDQMTSCNAVNCSSLSQTNCNSTQGCCVWQEAQVTPCYDYSGSNCPTWCHLWSNNTCHSDAEPSPSPSTDPSPSGDTKRCYQLTSQGRACTQVTISGTSCNSSSGYYESLDGCRSHMSCQTNEFIPNATCASCGANKTANSANCHGTAEQCCHSVCQYQGQNDCETANGKCQQVNGCWLPRVKVVFAYADGLGRITQTCYTDLTTNKIDQSTCSGQHGFCGEYSPNPCQGYDCKDGIGQNREGRTATSTLLANTYTSGATFYCVAGTSGGSSGEKFSFCCVSTDGSKYNWQVDKTERQCPSGYNIDTSKNQASCQTPIPACYKDSDGNYHWTADNEPSWELIPTVSKERDCQKEESPACYKKPDGTYTWGKHASTTGYTLVTAITTQEACDSAGACYKNNFNNYKWSATKPDECIEKSSCWVPQTNPEVGDTCIYNDKASCEATEGYKEVEGATKPEDCAPDETPACYLHDGIFEWGKYEKVTGYILIENIATDKYCKTPGAEACYKDPDGDYVWGDFANDDGYEIIASITDISKCGSDVPVKKTGLDASKMLYVFMAILMAAGIGFIYYSSVLKQNDQR